MREGFSREPVAVSRRNDGGREWVPVVASGSPACSPLSGSRLPATGYRLSNGSRLAADGSRLSSGQRLTAPNYRRSSGFTLIELVAAFVIFALGFGVLLQVLGGSLRTTSQSLGYSKAAMWAQSVLDTQGIGEPLQEGISRGRFDDQYGWELRISKYEPAPAQTTVMPIGSADANGLITQATPALDMFELDLDVSWGNQFLMHHAKFATVRVMNPPQAGNTIPAPSQTQPRASR